MKIDVFISYHTESSRTITEAIVNKLEHKGIRCWYAPRDVEGTYAGSIKRAIDSCSVFLVVLNKAASESRHVLNEIDIAFSRSDVVIIPFHIADKDISDDARYYLGRIHWIDGMTPDLNDRIEELSERILHALGRGKTEKKPEISREKIKNIAEEAINEVKLDTPAEIKTMTYDNGTYTGEVRNGERTGRGKYVWKNGDTYEGDFVRGALHGRGKYAWANGNTYEGDFENNLRTARVNIYGQTATLMKAIL